MCNEVRQLYETFESIEKNKPYLSKEQHLFKLKQLRRDWITVSLKLDSCTEKLNEVGNKIVFAISLN